VHLCRCGGNVFFTCVIPHIDAIRSTYAGLYIGDKMIIGDRVKITQVPAVTDNELIGETGIIVGMSAIPGLLEIRLDEIDPRFAEDDNCVLLFPDELEVIA
jgi:hypothetical protein